MGSCTRLRACVAAVAALCFVVSPAAARPAIGATPLAINTTTYQFELDTTIDLAADFDVASIDLTNYGVPWSSFLYEEPLPVSWETRLNATVETLLSSSIPAVVQLPITSKSGCPAQNASDAPGTYPAMPSVNDFSGCSACFDYDIVRNPVASFIRQAYTNYALAIALAFNSTGRLGVLVVGADANRYLEGGCPAALWASYTEFLMQVYVTVKSTFPTVAVAQSWSLETMMQIQDGQACKGLGGGASKAPAALIACTKAGYAALAGIPRDFFGFSAYPSAAGIDNPGGWRPWYITMPLAQLNASDAGNLVVTSAGILADDMVVNWGNGTQPVAAAAAAAAGGVSIAPASLSAALVAESESAADPAPECVQLITSNATYGASWFNTLYSAVSTKPYNAWVVTLASAKDALFDEVMSSCPCSVPLPVLQPYCNLLSAYRQACAVAGFPPVACEASVKVRGTLGVRDLFGVPREPLYSAVQAARTGNDGVAEGAPAVLRRAQL